MPPKVSKQSQEGTVTMADGDDTRESVARKYDEAAVGALMAKLTEDIKNKKEAERKREQQLAAVPAEANDVVMVAEALGIDEAAARRQIQLKQGDAVSVLREAAELPKKKVAA